MLKDKKHISQESMNDCISFYTSYDEINKINNGILISPYGYIEFSYFNISTTSEDELKLITNGIDSPFMINDVINLLTLNSCNLKNVFKSLHEIASDVFDGDTIMCIINTIRVPKNFRNKGIGSYLLRYLIESREIHTNPLYNKNVIYLMSTYSSEFDYEKLNEKYNRKIINKLHSFAIDNGFDDINYFIGYESKGAYINTNFNYDILGSYVRDLILSHYCIHNVLGDYIDNNDVEKYEIACRLALTYIHFDKMTFKKLSQYLGIPYNKIHYYLYIFEDFCIKASFSEYDEHFDKLLDKMSDKIENAKSLFRKKE